MRARNPAELWQSMASPIRAHGTDANSALEVSAFLSWSIAVFSGVSDRVGVALGVLAYVIETALARQIYIGFVIPKVSTPYFLAPLSTFFFIPAS